MEPEGRHTPESKAAIARGVRKRAGYKEVSAAARGLLWGGVPSDDVRLVALAKQARSLAPTDQDRRQWDRILGALASGHRIKVSTFPAVFRTDGDIADVELIADIESIFDEQGATG